MGKNPHRSGPMQFKPVFFKGQLYYKSVPSKTRYNIFIYQTNKNILQLKIFFKNLIIENRTV